MSSIQTRIRISGTEFMVNIENEVIKLKMARSLQFSGTAANYRNLGQYVLKIADEYGHNGK
ncbi:MAG: hypothetical protein V3T17_04275 [Pseudomonadales bacterium]